jgi:esterase/lipase
MKIRKRFFIILIPALLLIIFLLGPRIPVDGKLPPTVALPDTGLDGWLAAKEASIRPGLVPGTEKKIFWAVRPDEKTAYSIIYIHGFLGSRQELVPVCDDIAKSVGANIFYTRLAGHGQGPDGFKDISLTDWIVDVSEAYDIGKKIGDKLIVISLSTGGPLSLWIAAQKPDIAALVLLSPNLGPKNTSAEMILWPWGKLLIKIIIGEYRESTLKKNDLSQIFFTLRHHSDGLAPMMSSVALGRNVQLKALTQPSLFVYTAEDEMVSIQRIKDAFDTIGSPVKKLVLFENASHILAGNIYAPENNTRLTEVIMRFLLEDAGIKPEYFAGASMQVTR